MSEQLLRDSITQMTTSATMIGWIEIARAFLQ